MAALRSETSPPPAPPASGRGETGATAYLESGALDAWVAYLARRGVRFDTMPRDELWGWREARLTDPAGNRLCLYPAGEYRRYPPWRVAIGRASCREGVCLDGYVSVVAV